MPKIQLLTKKLWS